ncbi:MAG: hypothetical protein Q8L48_18235 [Archangium sp.]|nr:hypothetical protein [Archangium sp.]
MRWLFVGLLFGCETEETRAWAARRAELEQRKAELAQLEAHGSPDRVADFRRSLDLAAFVREQGVEARVFLGPGTVRLTASGTVKACRDTVKALAGARWLTEGWRLRLEADHCEWEARTGADFTRLEEALVAAPSPKWSPPPPRLLSRGVAEAKEAVAALEAKVRASEARLGAAALIQRRLDQVDPLVESLRARPAPCDLAVLDRELALDDGARGKLLEIEHDRVVHPLEPRGDFRLRGLVEVHEGVLLWHCEAL